jgi:3-deoxy-manno-octulosonate cytidylyltransferase (CMP-KDO synthetase)
MIEHVYRRTAEARGIDAVVVATDDDRIAAAVERFGGIARMTDPAHRTGTDRIAEIARALTCDILVNVQGDLPLVAPEMIAQVIAPLKGDSAVRMSTICTPIADPEEYARPSVVKVVRDSSGNALYFSRAPIPFGEAARACKHIGMYAYRREFLLQFAALPQTPLERSESLEQLRALEHGYPIRVVETQYQSLVEVDTPEDLERARQLVTALDPRNAVKAFRQTPGNAVTAFRQTPRNAAVKAFR